MPTAISQASSSSDRCELFAALPIESAMPVPTSICLKPPPAPMISSTPATGASAAPMTSEALRPKPRANTA